MENVFNDINEELNRMERNITNIRNILHLRNELNDFDLIDIFKELQNINDFKLDDFVYKLYNNKRITDKKLEDRLDEYKKEQEIIKPFMPFILLYSLYILN